MAPGAPSATEATGMSGLPPLWRGSRRRLLAELVAAGLAQALGAGAGAHLLRLLLTSGRQTGQPAGRTALFWLLVTAALVAGALKMAERVLTERLCQDYVHDIRLGLVRRNLSNGPNGCVGITVARTTNDLTAVKNWVAMGVAQLAVSVPVLTGAVVAMALLDRALLPAVVLPVAAFGLTACLLIRPTFARSRALRRARGRVSAHVADAVLAADSIRTGGGLRRELRRTESLSRELVSAAVSRARYAGVLRGAATAAAGLVAALVIGIGVAARLTPATITAALAIAGFVAASIHDLGRVIEYRQAYRAARRIIGPATLHAPVGIVEPDLARHADAAATPHRRGGSLLVEGVHTEDGHFVPAVTAHPGDRIVLDAGDRAATSRVLLRLVRPVMPGQVRVDGVDLAVAGDPRVRSLVGYAAQGMLLSRGSIARAVTYRSPGARGPAVRDSLSAVGLGARIRSLPKGTATVLRHGGAPLTVPERARLLLARALFDGPPLLVLDHLDADLGRDGRLMLRELLRPYPGIVVLAGDDAEDLVEPTHRLLVGPRRAGSPGPRT